MTTSPIAARRMLSGELLRLREEAGLTAAEVARRTGITPSTITRIERDEWKIPQQDVVTQLLDTYDADASDRTRLLQLVAAAGERGWWDRYRASLTDIQLTYLGLEAGASIVRTYNPISVPDLLQTPDYLAAVTRARTPDITESQVEDLLAVQARRQTRLQEPGLHLHAILGEGALRRLVGGQEVMREQLEALLAASASSAVTLRAIPYTAGALPTAEPYTIFTLPGPGPDPVLESSASGPRWTRGTDAVQLAAKFEGLVAVAASVAETRRMIAARLAKMPARA